MSTAVATTAAITAVAAPIPTTVAAPLAPLTARALFTGLSLVDAEGAATHVFLIQTGDGIQGLIAVGHFHEAEAPGFAGELVHDYAGRTHRAIRGKSLAKIFVTSRVRQITYEYIHNLFYPCSHSVA